MLDDIRPPRQPSATPVPPRTPLPKPTRPVVQSDSSAHASDLTADGTRQASSPDVTPLFGATAPVNADAKVHTPAAQVGDVAQPPHKPRSIMRRIMMITISLLVVCALAAVAWYQWTLRPIASDGADRIRVVVAAGSSPTEIGELLAKEQLIRSSLAFEIHTRLAGTRNQLQAGAYSLLPSESTTQIAAHLVSGNTDDDEFPVTFYPGGVLVDETDKDPRKKTDVQSVLRKAGFEQAEIDAALSKTYDYPILFAGKPAAASLEGYVYGETYSATAATTPEQLLSMAFAQFERVVVEEELVKKFAAQGLTLYEGITMASIIQSEMGSQQKDMAQVAQVFLKRYNEGIQLGSDVTAYYGADLEGKSRAVSVDTPYNTRIRVGLPPGPISSPGLAALRAVAAPSDGEYIYFLSGDDGVTYFATTNEQHEKNIVDHCKVGCSIP